MVVDLILNRKDDDELIRQGYTHIKYTNGDLRPLAYNPHAFYMNCMGYEAHEITKAMDYGWEKNVQDALCDYILTCGYNPEICDYIRSRKWLVAG